jgi:hypothetical protein
MKSNYLLIAAFALCSFITQASDVIITEIFADPTPSHGLPEKEFIELYNPGLNPIQLKGYTLQYSGLKTEFPAFEILPGQYVIVCKKGNEADFLPFGKVIGLSSFSLLNEGTLLVLIDSKGKDIFSVKYSSQWYAAGKDQGFSLEMIDKNYDCKGKQNWTSSASQTGATPGAVNASAAVQPDIEGPVYLSHYFEDQKLVLTFDENLNQLLASADFLIDNETFKVSEVKTDPYESNIIQLILNRVLSENDFFTLKISKVEDCSGNVMEPLVLTVGNFPAPDSSELLISEVLFNPVAGENDFVELYNNSDHKVNLKNWFLAHKNTKNEVEGFSLISKTDLIIGERSYLAITENKTALKSQYPKAPEGNIYEVSTLPSFSIASGGVVLADPSKRIFEIFDYAEGMHNRMLDDKKGVSLERVNFDVPASDIHNWQSASALHNFATPGYLNSQTESLSSNKCYVEPVIFFPYSKGDSSKTSLRILLSEPGNTISVKVLNRNGQVVKSLIENAVAGTDDRVGWDGSDNSGSLLPVGYYVFRVEVTSSASTYTFMVKTVLGAY